MKKKTRLKFRPLDFVMVIGCLSVFVFFVFLFWKDLNSATTRTDIDQIATVSFKHRVAQRKFSDRVVWERLQDNFPLYIDDTIRTADLADATIRFIDGTVLELHENTMIQISYSEAGVKLSVGGGNLEVDSSKSEKKVQINMDNGSTIDLAAGSKISAKSDSESGESNFQIQSGSGSVKNEDGTNQIIQTGESVKINSTGKIKKGGITVTSIASDIKVLNFEEEAKPVHLEWNASEDLENSQIIVETSRTKDFSVIEETYTAVGSSKLDLPADDGVIYWRIYAKEDEEEPVEGKVRIENVGDLALLAPANNSNFKYRSENPQINFRWSGNDYVDHYRFEVSSTVDFKNILFDEELSVQNVNLTRFSQGQYFWRITPYYIVNGIGYSEPSEVRKFQVEKKEKISPPVLSVPVNNAKLLYVSSDYEANFMWKSEVKSADYTLQVSDSKSFEKILYSAETKTTRYEGKFTTKTLPEGTYYWKILRNSDEDEMPVESEIREYTVAKYIPAENRLMYPPENYEIEEHKVTSIPFMWKLGDEYKSKEVNSLVQFAKTEDFSEIIAEYEVSQNEIKNIPLKTGNYYWRMGVFDEVSDDYNFTNSRKLKVLSELGIPEIIYPAKNQTIVVAQDFALKVGWNFVSGADYYKVRITDAEGRLVKEESNIRNNFAELNINKQETLNPEKLQVSVQAFAEETEFSSMRVGKQNNQEFFVRNPQRVKLGAPDENKEYDGLFAMRNSIALTWLVGEDNPDYAQFILRKVLPSGAVKVVQTIENPDKTIYFDRLTEGEYQWTVKATSKNGYNLDAINYKSFVVTSVPELAVAELKEPENNFVMGPAYLRKHRNLSFTWNPVVGATDYVFVLYQKTPEGLKKIYSESVEKSSSVKLKDLTILDVGEFEWQVIAYAHAKDGFEEQHSKVAKGNFKIDFSKPKKIIIKEPGRLYAN